MSDKTRLLTISQAAERLGISIQTLRVYADKGDVPAVRLPSGYRRFDPADIDRVLAEWRDRGESSRVDKGATDETT